MTESIEILRAAWTHDTISFHGKHFDFDDVCVVPKPRHAGDVREISQILDGLDADDGGPMAATKRRLQAKQLIHPDGMGTAFKVAVFSKGMNPPPALRGLSDPFARPR
jgi:hypothetical protein